MKITDQIHQLRLDFNIRINEDKSIPRFVNILIIFGEKITLIDTGVKGCNEKIMNYIFEQGRTPDEIDQIILTHSHPDHIGSAAILKEETGCSILAYSAEVEWIENINHQAQKRPVPGFSQLVDKPVNVDRLLKDDETIQFAKGLSARIIHTPGHSPGLISLWFPEIKLLFSGDAIPLPKDIPNYDNYFDILNSLDKIESLSGMEYLLSSWDEPVMTPDGISVYIEKSRKAMLELNKYVECEFSANNEESTAVKVLGLLGLPPFLSNPIVINAFRSHLK